MAVRYRIHGKADQKVLAELRWHFRTEEAGCLDPGGKNAFIARYLKHLEEMDRDSRTTHWLIEYEAVPVGVMTVRVVDKEPSPDEQTSSWGYLTNCYVMPEKRNRGLGSRLLDTVTSWARDRGLELLVVWPSEASYSFYRRAGFEGRDDPLVMMLNPERE